MGGSGAGKSTLLKVMAGLLSPQQGKIRVDGQRIDFKMAHSLFFLQSQEDILFNASILHNITLFDTQPNVNKHQRIMQSLQGLQLTKVIDKLPGGLNALVRESHAALSLGQRQRLLLARAMYSDRPILILDEPTANLDEDTAQQVMQTLLAHCQKHKKTLITVTHSATVLSMFDRTLHLTNGALTTFSPPVQTKSLISAAVNH